MGGLWSPGPELGDGTLVVPQVTTPCVSQRFTVPSGWRGETRPIYVYQYHYTHFPDEEIKALTL